VFGADTAVDVIDAQRFAVTSGAGKRVVCEAADSTTRDQWVKAIRHNIDAIEASKHIAHGAGMHPTPSCAVAATRARFVCPVCCCLNRMVCCVGSVRRV
jgi:hypothetical protein